MAQGLDVKAWDSDKSPSADPKVNETGKRTRVIGSRRIFQPQFKLQVLDSYRNDLDCRGNQRATARKYNIHRRQIQKWLQCEQNLRTSVEESAKNEELKFAESVFQRVGKKCETYGIIKNGDGKMDSALNRSAMIYTRLNDAVRTREENAVRPTLKQETKVYQHDDVTAVKIESQNLKRVAQKLYPSSQIVPTEAGEKIRLRTVHVGGHKFFNSEYFDANFNRVPSVSQVADNPLDLGPGDNRVPKERLSGDTPDETFEKTWTHSDKLTISGEGCLLKEKTEGQKFYDADAVPKCLVQKYTSSEAEKLCTSDCGDDSLLCSRDVDAESSSLLDTPATPVPLVPIATNSRVLAPSVHAQSKHENLASPYDSHSESSSDVSLDNAVPTISASLDVSPPKKAKLDGENNSAIKSLKNLDDPKSFSPKRKWMQESMTEGLTERSRSFPMLPIKQRVKMNFRSVPGSPEVTQSPKGVSPNFTIERLCCSDIKAEKDVPLSFHSPAESECYNWRPDACNYDPFPPVSCTSIPPPVLPFPPPLILPHRVIPDLVSLHFKPDAHGQKDMQPCNLTVSSYSPSYEDSILDIPLKEEKMSDSEENTDIDVLSTTPVEKKSFDFSGYNTGKRRSFSVQFKLTVLDAFYNDKDCNKNQRATARKFNINRRQVQKWLSQENDLRNEGSMKNGKYLQRQRLGNDREPESVETCTQCPQHCSRKKQELNETDVDIKQCTDKHCLSQEKSNSPAHFNEGLEFCDKNCFQSDLKSANIYDNYLIPDNNNLVYHGWPNLNSSALPVPNFQYLSSWYHHFDFCQEKAKIY